MATHITMSAKFPGKRSYTAMLVCHATLATQ